MKRRLVAALACRANGSRLYGKPLQILYGRLTILDQILAALSTYEIIDETILGISSEVANYVFMEIAQREGIKFVIGDPKDVLSRLISCGKLGGATDVFRITTECPFFDYTMLDEAWHLHLSNGNDVTVLDHVPEGAGFEIYTLEALERSHAEGDDRDRSEFCSNYARFNQRLFKVQILKPSIECQRLDLRLTVDYPEDLILCRQVYKEFKNMAPRVPLDQIINYLDSHQELVKLVAQYVDPHPVWDNLPQRT